jgi:RNA polymerase sigma-70 factor (ECF subfamily)
MDVAFQQFKIEALAELDTLYRTARWLKRSGPRAEDLVQETFKSILQNRDSLDLDTYSIRVLLLRTMYKLHLKGSGHQKLQISVTEREAPKSSNKSVIAVSQISPAGLGPNSDLLLRALNDLPEDYSVIILLWAVEDLSCAEIADVLEIPVGTVLTRACRARLLLDQTLTKVWQKTD